MLTSVAVRPGRPAEQEPLRGALEELVLTRTAEEPEPPELASRLEPLVLAERRQEVPDVHSVAWLAAAVA